MKFVLSFFLALSLTSCASFSHRHAGKIEFSDIEKLELGKTTKDQVRERFGKPVKTSPRSDTQEAWFYEGTVSTGTIGQKASFSFEGDTLVGALWMPDEADPLENVQAVQAHFNGARFTRKVKGWDQQGHSYSEDASYYDAERGILFTTSGREQSVSAIGFNIPSVKRNVSSENKE
jgi:outer membrane protein assembly factor BamE (lipoprotein component of BamABCDE complex)